jgi:hypothetical protein
MGMSSERTQSREHNLGGNGMALHELRACFKSSAEGEHRRAAGEEALKGQQGEEDAVS